MTHIENGTLLKYYPETINGQEAFTGNIRGSVNQTKVYYRMALIRSATGYIKILFGAGDDEQSRYAEDMDTVIHSLNQEK